MPLVEQAGRYILINSIWKLVYSIRVRFSQGLPSLKGERQG
jgi:hypothetical protein